MCYIRTFLRLQGGVAGKYFGIDPKTIVPQEKFGKNNE
jgi:hypothetical protein